MFLIRLKHKDGGVARWYTAELPFMLTASKARATDYSTHEAAQAAADALPKHPWGPWEVEARDEQP